MAGAAEMQQRLIPNRTSYQSRRLIKRTMNHSDLETGTSLRGKLLFFIVAFLLSRFMTPGQLYPAGIAFALVNREKSWQDKFFIWIGFFAGTFMMQGLPFTLNAAGILLIAYLADGYNKRKKSTHLPILTTIILWAIFRFVIMFVTNFSLYNAGMTVVEVGLSYLLILLFDLGCSFLKNPLKSDTKIARLSLALLAVLTLAGLNGFVVQSFKLADIVAVLLLITVSYLGGGGLGAAMGISIALMLGITTGGLVTLIALYGCTGLLGGFLKDLGKWGTVFGTCLGLFFVIGQVSPHFTLDLHSHLPWGIGMAAFLLTPRRYLSQISHYFSNENGDFQSLEQQARLREVITNRLNGLAEIFMELANSFNNTIQNSPTHQKIDIYTLLDQVCIKNCQHCNGYEVCWGEHFYSTYREIFDLIALAELYGQVDEQHLKGRLAKSCFQQYKLLETVNYHFEKSQEDNSWKRQLNESKVFLTHQLQGVSSIISNIVNEIKIDTCFKLEVEERLRNCFNRIGLYVKDLSVLSLREQGLEIRLKQASCNQKRECQYLVAPLISRLLGEDYVVWERDCHTEDGQCSYCLTPEQKYEIKTTVCKLAQNKQDTSGDCHTLQELKDGHFVVILSDGMGHGSKAALESSATVNMLEKLLESEIDRDFAIKMVNSVLLLRSPEESFATVDMALIDLYNPQAEFIKIGAAASYIKRGREIFCIQSTSLPAGILNTVDVERTMFDLQPGDFIVFVTDGIVDSKVNAGCKEDWIVRALRQVEVAGPEALGEYLLNLAKVNQDGAPKDDMTVIILQFNEKISLMDH